MSLSVLTGASGSGKTTLARALRKKHPGTLIIDLDDLLPLEPHDDTWRRRAYEAALRIANLARGPSLLIGQIVLPEAAEHRHASSAIRYGALRVPESIRVARLQAAGWSNSVIAKQVDWLARTRLFDVPDGVERRDFNFDGDVDSVVEAVADWASIQDTERCSSWADVLPSCRSLGEVAAVVAALPADERFDTYHPLPFAEFANLRTAVDREPFGRKVRMIVDAATAHLVARGTPMSEASIADIGANAGGLAFAFAQAGCSVLAVEPDSRYFALGRRVAELSGVEINWVHDELNLDMPLPARCDIAILLSVFQWAAKGGSDLERAGMALSRVSRRSEAMIFEHGFNKGYSALQTESSDHYAALIALLLTYTTYTDFRRLPSTELYAGQMRDVILCTGSRAVAED